MMHLPQDIKKKKMMMMVIPDDVLMEILHRLPLSSLLRFRYACKHWLSLTTSPFLTYPLLDRTIASGDRRVITLSQICGHGAHLTLLNNSGQPDGPPIRIGPHPSPLHISPSCNGIACVYSNTTAHLFNPTTKELLRLPNPSPALKSSCMLGFLPATKQYKVLRLYQQHSFLGRCACEVLTIGGKWRQIGDNFRRRKLPIEGATVNGVVYFIVSNWAESSTGKIVSFDPGDEKFRTVVCPNPPPLLIGVGTKLCEMGGRLCLADVVALELRIVAWEGITWSVLYASTVADGDYELDINEYGSIGHDYTIFYKVSAVARPLLLGGGKMMLLRESQQGGLTISEAEVGGGGEVIKYYERDLSQAHAFVPSIVSLDSL